MAKAAPPKAKPTPAKAQAVAVRETTAISDSLLEQMVHDQGAGLDDMGRDDLAIPMLSLLQPMSPQLQPGEASYIDGAAQGDIFNNVSHDIYDGSEGIIVVPVAYRRSLIEWWPRDSKKGKGFVREYPVESDVLDQTTRNDRNMDMMPGGTYIANTAQYYCLFLPEDEAVQQVVISMTSTQLKKSRKWNTMMKMKVLEDPKTKRTFPAPMFAFMWRMKALAEKNDKGHWMGWDIQEEGPIHSALYGQAKAFSESIRSGLVKVKMTEEEAGTAETNSAY